MDKQSTSILNDNQIKQKVRRLAFEIIEQNIDTKRIFFVGINNNGYRFAQMLLSEVETIDQCPFVVQLCRVQLNPAKPLSDPIILDVEDRVLKNQTVILIDDVANTGRTLFYACKPFMNLILKKLVDRKHKSWPIHVDFVGISLATTVKNHIDVNLSNSGSYKALIS